MRLLQRGSLSHCEILSLARGNHRMWVLPGLQGVFSESGHEEHHCLWDLGSTMNPAEVPRPCTAVRHWVCL